MTEETLKNVTLQMLLPTTKIISSLKMRIWSSSEIKYKEVKPIVEKLLVLGKKSYTKTSHRTGKRSVYTN
jgi:ribosomal protein L17